MASEEMGASSGVGGEAKVGLISPFPVDYLWAHTAFSQLSGEEAWVRKVLTQASTDWEAKPHGEVRKGVSFTDRSKILTVHQ